MLYDNDATTDGRDAFFPSFSFIQECMIVRNFDSMYFDQVTRMAMVVKKVVTE